MGKERFIHKLTEQDITRLKEFDREIGNSRVHTRVHAILLSRKGYNIRQISQIVDLAPTYLGEWFNRYEREGVTGLLDRPRSGRPAKITQSHIRLMLEAVEKSPRLYGFNRSNWSGRLLAQYLKKRIKREISQDWVRLLLIRFGFRCGRGKLRVVSSDP